MKRRKAALLLIVALLLQLLSVNALATDDTYLDDPMYWSETQQGDGLFEEETITFDTFRTRKLESGETLKKGVDVSYYQNERAEDRRIDWVALKEDGVDFVFIRVGYRGYSTGGLSEDRYYEVNLQGALDAGLSVGVYFFSQAITEEEGREEARFLMERIAGYDVTLPLIIDYEYAGSGTGRLYDAKLSKAQATAVCNAFMAEANAGGYQAAVYANKSFLNNQLNADQISRVWMAHYAIETDYAGDYDFWQCTSSGSVDGIVGLVDLNFWYDDGTVETGLPFVDVSGNTWAYEGIKYAYDTGMITGVTLQTFAPTQITTRSQIITMLYRLAGSPEITGEATFTDLVREYYKAPIAWGQATGITTGTPGNLFDPEGQITRQDMVTMLYRMAGKPAVIGDLSAFKDEAEVSDYAEDAMIWAVNQGLIKGVSATEQILNPKGTATRAEAATLLARFAQLN